MLEEIKNLSIYPDTQNKYLYFKGSNSVWYL